jgi:glycosyltransferase involved in cell wall biosynthesis
MLFAPGVFNEPFGLTLIESMACGCPVVAFDKGSIPEIVEHEKTGFVVNNVVEMILAVSRIAEIDRKYCRNYVLNKFNVKNMVDKYEEIYKRIIKENKEIKTAEAV